MNPRVRIAPSPTGNPNIGTARTALFNFLFAKKQGGVFIVRIEDTDKARSKKEYEKAILDGFDWLGIKYDELYRQSDRTAIYSKWLEKLVGEDRVYISKEENDRGRSEVIRFRNPNKDIVFKDTIRGQVSFNTEELGDFVVAKSLEEPLYHFAVVVDDFEMGITNVIRGEDHISNTPRQILIQEVIGAARPTYSHIPLILAKDRSKLSKRHGARSITEFKEQGFLPEAMVNYLALLGWHPEDKQEIFSLNELVEKFDLARVQKGGAIFDEEKLLWINREHMKRMPREQRVSELAKRTGTGKDVAQKIESIICERISRWGEVDDLVKSGELDYLFKKPQYDANLLKWKGKQDNADIKRHLERVKEILQNLDEKDFVVEKVKESIWGYTEKEGTGAVLWPLRVALTGKEKSPDPFTVAAVSGKSESISRIDSAIEKVS
jgi:glutamyl-tRNA synthetase